MLALEGIKVLDFCRNAPGMFATMILADLGAEVLMIERPMDETRAAYERVVSGIETPEDERRHASYNALQRNKRSIALNLKEPEALEIFRQLAADADVVAEGFRPGVAHRLGIGYEQVREINPRAVYCSVSGYGQTGPYAPMAGHDINYISFAGALGLIGDAPDSKPAIPLNLIADYAGGGLCGRGRHYGRPAGPRKNRPRPVRGHRHDRGRAVYALRNDRRRFHPGLSTRPRRRPAQRRRSLL